MGKPVQGLGTLIATVLGIITVNYLVIVGIIALIQLIWSLGASSWLIAVPVYLVLGLMGKLPSSTTNK